MGVTVGLGGTDPRDRRRQRSTTTTTATTTTHSNHIWQPIHLLTGFVGLYIVGTMIFLITFQNSSNNNNDSGININNNYGNYQASNDRSSLISPPSLVKKKESQHSPTQSEPQRPQIVHAIFDESKWAKKRNEHVNCTYKSLSDLQPHEAYPSTEYDGPHRRHSVNPPSGGNLSLVCCETTVGNLNIVTHHNWAPHGAKRFMDMVNTGYFNSQGGVPMMRCLKGFICQFGLHSDPSISRQFSPTIPDDPNWLPQGPTHRENEHGVKRFAKGYLAYAGGGNHSRNNQLIVALEGNGPLGGGSPWEVPWGELVSSESYETLGKIYTGYGEKGPPQGKLMNRGMTAEMKTEFPLVDYIQSCTLVDEAFFHVLSKDE